MNIRQTLIHFLGKQSTRLSRDGNRVAALNSAHSIMAHRFPMWVESGFTKRFLLNDAGSLMEPFLQGDAMPKPQALAEAWSAISPFSEVQKERAIAEILPVMVDFVYVLQGELRYFARMNPQSQITESSPHRERVQN